MKKHQMNSAFSNDSDQKGPKVANAEAQEGRALVGTPNLLGFTFHLSWMFLFLFLQEPGASAEITRAASPSALYLASTLALAATLGAFAIRPAQLCGFMANRCACLGAAAITALGTIGYCASLAGSWHVSLLAVVGGVLTGIGSGALAARWACAFGRAGISGVLGITPAILAGAIALCVTLPFLPHAACVLIVCVLPLLSGAFAYRAAHDRAADARPHAYDDGPLATGRRRCYLALVVFIALLGTILGCLNVSTHSPLFAEYISLVFATATVAVLSACLWHLGKRSTSNLIIAGIVPICAIVCLLVLLMRINENDFFSSFIPIGSTCLEMLFLATLVIFSIRFKLSTVRTFAIGRISYALFYLVGTAAGTQLNIAGSETATVQATSFLLFAGIELITGAAIVGLVFARQTTRRAGEAHESVIVDAAKSQEGRTPAASTDAHVADTGATQAAAPTSLNEDANTAEKRNGHGSADASDPGNPPQPVQAYPTASPSSAPTPTGEQQPEQSAMQSGKFERRIIDFAETYGLSARETDVLRQLLKGRGYARIQQELHIAEGTVNYHVRNIYAKTNVHSREKLIDLFDDLE